MVESTLESVKSTVNIIDVVSGSGIELKKKGSGLVACCPFHEEKTPSFTVDESKQKFYCFGCKERGDVVDFYSKFNNVSISEAIKALNTGATSNTSRPIKRAAINVDPYEKFFPIEQPPLKAGDKIKLFNPKSGKTWTPELTAVYQYSGGYVIRYYINGEKQTPVISWCKKPDGSTGWCNHRFNEKPLYHFNADGTKNILIVEGEKAADAGRELLKGRLDVITWQGGTSAVNKVDWSQLAGRRVIILPDNDKTGIDAANTITGFLKSHGCNVTRVSPPAGLKNGWDIADKKWSGSDELLKFLRDNVSTEIEATAPEITPEPTPEPEPPAYNDMPDYLDDEPEHNEPEPAPNAVASDFIKALGYDRGYFYYWSASQKQIVKLNARSHVDLNLIQIASLHFWEEFAPADKGGVNWKNAANILMRECESVGVFNPANVRGRGCWIDGGAMVMHLGDRIEADGGTVPLSDYKSNYIYEASARVKGPADEILSNDDAMKIINLCERFSWEMPASAALLCGWLVLAPVCGAIKWRPHIWLTGGTGTGKSTIMDDFIKPLLAGTALSVQGNSTEAGIRQTLGSDAMPVLFDESEQNNEQEERRIQGVLSLMRQSSSDGQAKTLKGTASGNSLEFLIRSMFCLASIQVGIKQQADHTRISVLRLKRSKDVDSWAETQALLSDITNDKTFGSRLMRRTIAYSDILLDNIKIFKRVAAQHFKNQRLGDQYGTLLAGCYLLFKSTVVTPAEARIFIESFNWGCYVEEAEEDESQKALDSILQIVIRADFDRGSQMISIGELIQICSGKSTDSQISKIDAKKILNRYGIKVNQTDLLIANKSDQLAQMLRGKPWGIDWKSYLQRIEGAKKIDNSIRFGHYTSRASSLPLSLIS